MSETTLEPKILPLHVKSGDPVLQYYRSMGALGAFKQVALAGFNRSALVGAGFHHSLGYAQEERNNGYAYLYALLASQTWAILEAWVEDSIVYLLGDPAFRDLQVIRDLKGPVLEFAAADEFAQRRMLYELFVSWVKGKEKSETWVDEKERDGVGRFEMLFRKLGRRGTVPKDVSDWLYELSQVRNSFAHKSAYADAEFIRRCPDIGATLNERIPVTEWRVFKYQLATKWYVSEIIGREGAARDSDYDKLLAELLQQFRDVNPHWPTSSLI